MTAMHTTMECFSEGHGREKASVLFGIPELDEEKK
jgi:hypothetical protein